MSLADEVLAKHQRTYNEWREGGFCSKCKEAFPCESVRLALALRAAEKVVEVAKKLQRDYEDEVPADFAAGNLGHRVRAELGLTQDIAIDYAELYEATTKPRL